MEKLSPLKILDRIKEYYDLTTDIELSDFLGVSRSTVASYRNRGSVNYDLIFSKCPELNFHWLITGEGPQEALQLSKEERERIRQVEKENKLLKDQLEDKKIIIRLMREQSENQ